MFTIIGIELVSSIATAIIVALSFLQSKAAARVVCVLVFSINILGCLLMGGIIKWTDMQLAGPYPDSGPAIPERAPSVYIATPAQSAVLIGAKLLCFYFVACAVCCLPFIPHRSSRAIGIGLHCVLMPIALIIVCCGQLADLVFPILMIVGLPCAILWFRMADLRGTILKKAGPSLEPRFAWIFRPAVDGGTHKFDY